MSEFRIMLLLLGLAIILGIYLWGVGFDSKKLANRLTGKARKKTGEVTLDTPMINPKEEEFDYTDVFRSQGGLKRDDDADPDPDNQIRGDQKSVDQKSIDKTAHEENMAKVDSVAQPAEAEKAPEVIVLYVTASEGAGFNGGAIRDALYASGMVHGDMEIFHHYGLGQSVSETSIFSLANMLEPGTFNLEQIDDLQTSGVVLFMQLPTPIDPAIAFEHMLSTAQRLGDVLQGQVRDKQSVALTSKAVEGMRAFVAGYNKRNTSNAENASLSR